MAHKDNHELENQSCMDEPFNIIIPAFFRAWDNPLSRDADWITFFAPNCVLKFGAAVCKTYDDLRAMRAGFVDPNKGPVVDMQHNLHTCWTLTGADQGPARSFIIKSSIWYRLLNGVKIEADCTTYMRLEQKAETGSWHATEYEVFMSSFEIMDAIKSQQQNPPQGSS